MVCDTVEVIGPASIDIPNVVTEGKVEGGAAEELDNFASLSAISRNLKGIPKCVQYPHGLIGFD